MADTNHSGTSITGGHTDVVAAGASGFMSGADKTKLNGIAPGANVTGANPPQAHAASHKLGGSDVILLNEFGLPTSDVAMSGQGLTGARMATIAPGDGLTTADILALNRAYFLEDWLTGDITGQNNKWSNVVAGTGTVTVLPSGGTDMHPGQVVLTRGTTAVSRAFTGIGTTSGQWVVGTNGTLYQHWCFQIPTLSDGTNTFTLYMGFGDTSAAGQQANGLGIIVDTNTNPNIGLIARAASTGAASFGTFAMPAGSGAAGWVNARIKKANGSTAFGLEVLIAGTWTDQGISISTNIPTGQMLILAKLDGTAGAASRTANIDFVESRTIFPNGRT